MPLVVLSTKKVSCDPQVGGGEPFFGPSISTQADLLSCPKMLLMLPFSSAIKASRFLLISVLPGASYLGSRAAINDLSSLF